MLSKGRNYSVLPKITKIKTALGKDAILSPEGYNIGRINEVDIQDIGFEYSADNTLRPQAELPQILKLNTLNSFDSIGISSVGQNYVFAPNLVVIDNVTKSFSMLI